MVKIHGWPELPYILLHVKKARLSIGWQNWAFPPIGPATRTVAPFRKLDLDWLYLAKTLPSKGTQMLHDAFAVTQPPFPAFLCSIERRNPRNLGHLLNKIRQRSRNETWRIRTLIVFVFGLAHILSTRVRKTLMWLECIRICILNFVTLHAWRIWAHFCESLPNSEDVCFWSLLRVWQLTSIPCRWICEADYYWNMSRRFQV